MKTNNCKVNINLDNGKIIGENIIISERKLRDLVGIFEDKTAVNNMNLDDIIYRVEAHVEEKEGKEGGLFFGTSFVYPGTVGNEYYMTKGHFHSKIDTAEYYLCIKGEGMLIMMDEQGECWTEKMVQGSLHYIKGNIAHRIANTGDEILTVVACWPSDAGHDYKSIEEKGFNIRLVKINGVPNILKK